MNLFKQNLFNIIISHIILGIMFFNIPETANYFSLFVVIYGIRSVLKRELAHTALVMGYMSSFGILLKLLNVGVFWEFDKYVIALLSCLVLLMYSDIFSASNKKYLVFFLLLIPGMALIKFKIDPLSLYMTGPFVIAVTLLFFTGLKGINIKIEKLLLFMLGPIITLSSIVSIHTMNHIAEITWGYTAVSEKYTSGGFGPNQVSLVLGFGMVIMTILYTLPGKSVLYKLSSLLMWSLFAIQSGLTWSRGGLFGGLLGSSILLILNMNNRRLRINAIIFIGCLFLSINYMFDNLDQFTEGAFLQRIISETTTGRAEMAIADFIVFWENPILGVGVGKSTFFHDITGFHRKAGSHTFFTRLLAEHGLFGLIALIILIGSTYSIFTNKVPLERKAISIALMSWTIFSMSHNDLRLSLPAFIFAFSVYFGKVKNVEL